MAEKIHILAAEDDTAEKQLELTHEDALLLAEEPLVADADCLPEFFEREFTQSAESAQLDELLAAGGSNRVAAIPAVDRIVDAVVERGPIDVQVGTSRIKNPG